MCNVLFSSLMQGFNQNTVYKLNGFRYVRHGTAAESYRLLREAYGELATLKDTCEQRWFRRFKSGDFEVAH